MPIAALSEIDRAEVSIQGRVVQLWESDHPKIHQVGLVEDDTGRTKFTSWKKSRARTVSEGDWVVFRGVAKSWYQGRCSVAVTGTSSVLVRR